MAHKLRYRILIVAAILGVAGQIPILIHILFLSQDFPAFYNVIQNMSAFVLAPFCAIFAFVGARRELRGFDKSTLMPLKARNMRITTVIGAAGSMLWVALVVLTLLLWGAPDVQSDRDHIMNALNNLAAEAYQYRIHPSFSGEGDGSYVGFQIPKRFRADSAEGFSYSLISIWSDSIILEGRYERDRIGAMRVQIDSAGRLVHSQYFGDFR